MSTSTVRIGVVGCGAIARAFHLRILQNHRNVRLSAIADADESNLSRAKGIAEDAQQFSSASALIESRLADGVVVCLPPALHVEVGVAALRAGCHVYMEKPIATSSVDAERLVNAWRDSGKVGMMGFNFRLNGQFIALRDRVRSAVVGKVIAVRTTFTIPTHELPAWKRQRTSGGGVLLDLASHHADLVEFILQEEVQSVFATCRSFESEADHAAIQLITESGTAVQSLFSLGTADAHRIEVWGTRGMIEGDLRALRDVTFTPATFEGARTRRVRRALAQFHPRHMLRHGGDEPSFSRALDTFIHAIRNGSSASEVTPDLHDGARSLRIVEAMERSIATGEPEIVA